MRVMTTQTPTIDRPPRLHVGTIGRVGRWTATHVSTVVAIWVVVALGLGLLAPRVETALSGAGWEATGSESVQARALIDQHFDGLGSYGLTVVVHSPHATVADPAFARALERVRVTLKRSSAVTTVLPPSISPDHRSAVIRAGAAHNADGMVRVPDDLKGPLAKLGTEGIRVDLTGAPGTWSDFNEANR